jgi:hypothetical protein
MLGVSYRLASSCISSGRQAYVRLQQLQFRGQQRLLSSTPGVLPAGKYKGMAFEDVYAKQPRYCSWVLTRGEALGDTYAEFLAFLRAKPRVEAPRDEPPAAPATPRAAPAVVAQMARQDPVNQPNHEDFQAQSHQNAQSSSSYHDSHSGRGDARVGFGKYKDLTYEELLSNDPEFCSWVRRRASEAGADVSPAFRALAAYLAGVELPQKTGFSRASKSLPRQEFNNRFQQYPPTAWNAQSQSSGDPTRVNDAVATERPQMNHRPKKTGTLMSGCWPLTFGKKHNGTTFAQVLRDDTPYCDFVVNTVLQADDKVNPDMLAFSVYILYQALEQQAASE